MDNLNLRKLKFFKWDFYFSLLPSETSLKNNDNNSYAQITPNLSKYVLMGPDTFFYIFNKFFVAISKESFKSLLAILYLNRDCQKYVWKKTLAYTQTCVR